MRCRKFLLMLFCFGLCNSCISDLPFEAERSIVPVVNCLLTNDSVQTLSLTQSVKITDRYVFKEIEQAEISLSANGALIGRFERTDYDHWQLNYLPEAGTTYQLLVQLPDGTELTASTTMPEADLFTPLINEDRYPSRNFRQTTANAPCWIYILNNRTSPPVYEDPVPDKNATLNEYLGTDHPLIDRFNRDDYLLKMLSEATVPGYLFYIRIQASPDMKDGGEQFRLQTYFGLESFVCLRSASDEYDRYFKSSLQKMFVYQSEDDPAQWFDESRVYSNITNGTGIFAAYNEQLIYYEGNEFVVHKGKFLLYDKDQEPFFQY
jgi:hypothetical protein